ncbi:uncharacterized protein N7477_006455 [Penicillium maclennaniae]|uniref:uncharacterized protein n=1 Tax=Penicillium maclennaniae TaxID=1343394 RepID=UPI002540CAE3|nr:uncharacterized protein N7477_006455 [Penicillium maclennaniae]KAJ5667885.1 hypothetical protein N7477_006455 [Penicillium maclennaniae]
MPSRQSWKKKKKTSTGRGSLILRTHITQPFPNPLYSTQRQRDVDMNSIFLHDEPLSWRHLHIVELPGRGCPWIPPHAAIYHNQVPDSDTSSAAAA